MKLIILIYAIGFSTLLIGMDSKNTLYKLIGSITILIGMLVNACSIVI